MLGSSLKWRALGYNMGLKAHKEERAMSSLKIKKIGSLALPAILLISTLAVYHSGQSDWRADEEDFRDAVASGAARSIDFDRGVDTAGTLKRLRNIISKDRRSLTGHAVKKTAVPSAKSAELRGPRIHFFTKHLDRTLYRQAILKYISEHFQANEDAQWDELRRWEIYVEPFDKSDGRYDDGLNGKFPSGIPHGVTGQRVVKVFVEDKQDDLFFKIRVNFKMISHELAHMTLKIKFPDRKGTLKYDEISDGTGWGRRGEVRNFFSVEIHNREWETRQGIANWIRDMTVYVKSGQRWRPIPLRVVDISDLTS
jgi:hypothetical protein